MMMLLFVVATATTTSALHVPLNGPALSRRLPTAPSTPAAFSHLRMMCTGPDRTVEECNLEFDDCERECFGDEDGCDLWYYGVDPTEPTMAERQKDPAKAEALRAAGDAVVARREAMHRAQALLYQRREGAAGTGGAYGGRGAGAGKEVAAADVLGPPPAGFEWGALL